MVAVVTPATSFHEGYFAVGDDDVVYLDTAAGAIPLGGSGSSTVTLTRIGADWFRSPNSSAYILPPTSPATVGDSLFEGSVAGTYHGESAQMFIGLGIGSQQVAANPLAILGANCKVWYDLQDLSTLFADFVGTPATVGSAVALQWDKANYGLGSDIKSTGATGMTGTATAATYNTSTGAGTAVRVNTSNLSYVEFTGIAAARVYLVDIENTGATTLSVRYGTANVGTVDAGQRKIVYVPVLTGAIRIYVNSDAASIAFTIHSVKEVLGTPRHQVTSAQRPILRQTAGGVYYLECDGSDDGMVTPSLNLSGTDKIGLFTAVRKLSDATTSLLVEFSANASSTPNTGGFYIAAPDTAVGSYTSMSRASNGALTSQSAFIASATAPDTAVLTATHDMAGDLSRIRRNGAAGTNGTGEKGTGNFGNYPLYFFRRGGSTLPFNGHSYGFALCDTMPSAAQIAAMEAYYNALAGAY